MQALPKTRNTVIAVFSTQEEVGCRGAKTAAYSAVSYTHLLSALCYGISWVIAARRLPMRDV